MKKVLLVTYNFFPEVGSGANRLTNIYFELKNRGYDVTVITSEPNYPNRNMYKDYDLEKFSKENPQVYRVKTSVRKYNRNMLRRLFFYLELMVKMLRMSLNKDARADYVYVTSPPIFLGIIGYLHKKIHKSTFILDIRDLWPETLKGVKVFDSPAVLKLAYSFEQFLYNKADHITFNSKGFLNYFNTKEIDEEKLTYIPNSISDKEFGLKVTEQLPLDEIKVIYTGNMGLAQDMDLLVDVATRLKDTKNIRFHVMGYGVNKNNILETIKEKGLQNISFIKERLRKEALLEIKKSHIAFASLIDEDVFDTVIPGKIIDYMAMEVPIVGALGGHAKNVIDRADCGLVSETRDVNELCNHIMTLANSEIERQRLAKNGRKYAEAHFSWGTNMKEVTTVLGGRNETNDLYVRVESL